MNVADVSSPARPDAPISPQVWRLAGVIASGAFLSGLDASVVSVGLDTLTRDLDTTLATAQWVATGYLIAFAASLPLCAWLARRAGAGRLWLWCLVAFTMASAACAAAPNVEWLIGLRVVQGLAAGMLIPAGQTVLGRAVGPHRLGRVMATLGVAVTLAPALGPVVGGVVIHVGSWPWLFLLNVPIGLVALWLGRRWVPRGEPVDPGRLDWVGLLLVSVGLPLVVYGCTRWGETGNVTGAGVAGPLVGGVLALLAYGVHAGRSANPILDLGLFRNRIYRAATVTATFTGAALFGAGLLFPLYYQLGRGAGPLESGLLLIAMSLGSALVLPLSGRLVDRFGGGLVSFAGGLATVVTTVPFAVIDVDAAEWLVQLLLLVRGAALACAVVPAMSAAFKAVTAEQLPDATSEVNIVSRVGGALGGAIFAIVVATHLPDGVDAAFHASFRWLLAASVLATLAAAWLLLAERGAQPEAPAPARAPAR
ncbi:DHA2 family efflux MFS transporter permease subunit [Cryptosporangium aurantiacum]|uniref:Drug resistance transporter, EmrB/QacA subfamily n=1 Tax=Cryptosporangium aurantiacum TaxID=134849 RepID=A0A1M7H5U9_9ACTN|nr:DHA2 family efflux MFS transporter permease subunit [Cryptosporangium aurantiacum]SHM23716.1 drug resistance transporter, EmrB/QacA subfamily [Cryptosporangium aurantiacum]